MNNPANEASPRVTEATRVPMSTPQRKLEAPEKEGQHRHWFLEANVPRAIRAGYTYVHSDDVELNQSGVGTSTEISGNADLGTRVKIIGGTNAAGQSEYLVLMEIRLDWWQKDQKVLEERNASILSGIFRKEQIAGSEQVSAEDRDVRYVKTALFQRPTRKGK